MGWTALEYAIERHQATIALMLLRADAPLENRDRVRTHTRLHQLDFNLTYCNLFDLSYKFYCLCSNEGVQKQDSALHLACRKNLVSVVQTLCATDCQLDLYNLVIRVYKYNTIKFE